MIPNGIYYFEVNFQKNKLIFFTVLVLSCIIVTKLFYGLVAYVFWGFISYFCLVLGLSDGMLILLLNLVFKRDINFLMQLMFVVVVV